MSERQQFYRFHWADCPPFSAHNAYSALWGAERSADGSQSRCSCTEGGIYPPEDGCDVCQGTGWEDCLDGYSACASAQELHDYFAGRGEPTDTDGEVIIFHGRVAGSGPDGEPLVVPEGEPVARMPWSRFATALAEL